MKVKGVVVTKACLRIIAISCRYAKSMVQYVLFNITIYNNLYTFACIVVYNRYRRQRSTGVTMAYEKTNIMNGYVHRADFIRNTTMSLLDINWEPIEHQATH